MSTSTTSPRTQIICIDWENVQPELFPSLEAEHLQMVVFVGPNQSKLSFPIVEAVQKMGSRARYVKVSQTGNNALDMHMAFQIGRLSMQQPNAYFHIVAKDRDYDPLIMHLKSLGIGAAKWPDVMSIDWIQRTQATSKIDQTRIAVEWLSERPQNRPATRETLQNTLYKSVFVNRWPLDTIDSIIANLESTGVITFTNSKVSYREDLLHG